LADSKEYKDHLHEEVHLLHNQIHPLLPDENDDNNDDDDVMGSRVIMAGDDNDIEVNRPEDVPSEEEDEELEPTSDEDGGEIFDTDSEDDA
jgi:hypothetical protein